MDLSFLTGSPQQQPGAYSWLSNNQNQGMNFNSPAMSYQPGSSIGMDFTGANASVLGGGNGYGSLNSLGMNIPTFQLGLGSLGTLGNLYGAFQANNLAKDQLRFTKDVTNTNLNNQIKSYNTALADRARSRAVAENRDQSYADKYIADNSLSR